MFNESPSREETMYLRQRATSGLQPGGYVSMRLHGTALAPSFDDAHDRARPNLSGKSHG